jgi:hypothetical protein
MKGRDGNTAWLEAIPSLRSPKGCGNPEKKLERLDCHTADAVRNDWIDSSDKRMVLELPSKFKTKNIFHVSYLSITNPATQGQKRAIVRKH